MRKFFLLLCCIYICIDLSAQRNFISLDGKWNFCTDSMALGLNEKWFQNGLPLSKAEIVTVPHTWNMTQATARFWGWGWYQRSFSLPGDWSGKTTWIEFDAVYHDASVWVNGKKVGENIGSGFTRFSFDISKFVRKGENILTVLADNSFSENCIPYLNSFDWANDGGIIRSVRLVQTGTPSLVHALVSPSFEKLNDSVFTGKVNLNLKYIGRKGMDLNRLEFQVSVQEENQVSNELVFQSTFKGALSDSTAFIQFGLKQVNLWHFNHPNLYKMSIKVLYKNKITDEYTTNFGFRCFETQQYAVLFNGEKIRFAGIESMPGSSLKNGMAESKAELEAYLHKIQYLNGILTRFHWQQDEFVLDWCDRNGLLVQEEIPIWGGRTKLSPRIMGIAKKQLATTITSHYNHPCIVSWGVGNEIAARDSANISGVETLCRFVKSLDSTRLVTYVSNTLQQARWYMPPGTLPDASAKGDLLMFNDYHTTWYRQAQAGMGSVLDTIKIENPVKPLVISEFGLCQPENWGDDPKRITNLIYSYGVYESKPHIAGVIYFCVNDYRTHMGTGTNGFHTTRVHGVFDLEGNPKPSAEFLRELNCPFQVTGLNRNAANNIDITLAGSLGFPSFVVKGYKLYWSPEKFTYRKTGKSYALPDIHPGKLHHQQVDNSFRNRGVLTIENPLGRIVYQKEINDISTYY
jgi:beta-galactosidase